MGIVEACEKYIFSGPYENISSHRSSIVGVVKYSILYVNVLIVETAEFAFTITYTLL